MTGERLGPTPHLSPSTNLQVSSGSVVSTTFRTSTAFYYIALSAAQYIAWTALCKPATLPTAMYTSLNNVTGTGTPTKKLSH